MANILTVRNVVDGPRNVVTHVTGIIDTADFAVGAALSTTALTFNSVLGSRTITFTASAQPPIVGQYVTFADGTTTFAAGTYITEIVSATSVILSTAALTTNVNINNVMTGVAGNVVLIDPSFLSALDVSGTLPTRLILDKVSYNIESALALNLYWKATSSILLLSLVNSGDDLDFKDIGGLWNNAGAGITGQVLLNCQGWSGGATLSFNATFEWRKNK